jgi:hypothetical protein
MSKLSSFFLFLAIYLLSILVVIPFIIFNNDPKTGDFLIYLVAGIFAVEFILYYVVFGLIKFAIRILERR